MTWTIADIERLKKQGKIKDFKATGAGNRKKKAAIPRPAPEGLKFIIRTLQAHNVPYIEEYAFAKPRRFRFDVALVERMIAFEYEGIFSKKSRHTSLSGYSKDTEKYNIAASLGWKVYRYTAMNYRSFESDLKKIIKS